jgi:serine/threonine protein kinase
MAAPTTTVQLLELVRKSGFAQEAQLNAYLDKARTADKFPAAAAPAAILLVRDGILTRFQARQLLQGRWGRFLIGNYKVLDHIGSGGMADVFLCEHRFMRRRAAVKVLPRSKASNPVALERFYREARAAAALDHPNIVHAYDLGEESDQHFLAMEYVEGSDLHQLVQKSGPLEPTQAADYIRQAASGLQHAHEVAGLVHRDVKPANLMVDRNGVVKILDLGLARFFEDQDTSLTLQTSHNYLGTADFLAPEQALDSHGVDIRADLYSLGATFYFCLTGKPPFQDESKVQKLIRHQSCQPKPLDSFRSDVPPAMAAIVEKMMAKDPNDRYQLPIEVAQALAPWSRTHPVLVPAQNRPCIEPVPTPEHGPEVDFSFTTTGGDASEPDDDRLNLGKLKDTAESSALDDTRPLIPKKKAGRECGRQRRLSYGLDSRRIYVVAGAVAGVMGLIVLLASFLAFLGD